ncbi:Rieske 2Fe-2S domain-containing protein [uncultured Nostoc sp.]|uniref:aromatic ring-hydroxylating dioxygenase subunit alpha n=1 Tax=uncultured Nostoc sp. TaxID=340711 RepID=UPI0035CBFD56
MSLETETLQATPPTSTFETLEEKQEFNWRQCWYPVTFVQDLPTDRPHSFSLYDEPLVLFKNKDGQFICLTDRCPHRTAKLSDGQIIDGKIECLYHGWQFGSDGQCLHIPQLPADAKIPANACVQSFKVVERQGMIWVWAGEKETAVDENIPILPDLDKPGFVCADFILDLPYDQTYLIENVTDPAHVAISHHGTRGGSNRKNAQPLEMEVLESSAQGIRAKWRGINKSNEAWKYIDFVAPSLVLNNAYIEDRGWTFGLALYSIPLGKGRCRLLARGYRNFMTWGVKLRPRWLDHLNTNKILEQDLPLIAGQQSEIERLKTSLKELYLPLKTSDTLVVEYRKWLDKFGSSLPFYQGYSTWKNVENDELNTKPILLDRFSRHTLICSSCNRAYQVTNRVKQSCIGVAIALAAVAILADDSRIKIAAISFSVAAVVMSAMAQTLKTHFERSYTRH